GVGSGILRGRRVFASIHRVAVVRCVLRRAVGRVTARVVVVVAAAADAQGRRAADEPNDQRTRKSGPSHLYLRPFAYCGGARVPRGLWQGPKQIMRFWGAGAPAKPRGLNACVAGRVARGRHPAARADQEPPAASRICLRKRFDLVVTPRAPWRPISRMPHLSDKETSMSLTFYYAPMSTASITELVL